MPIARLTFAGEIKKSEHKIVGGKPLVEASICRKQKGRDGAEDTFMWLRIAIWSPAEFQTAKLVKGAFIAGSGELSTRAFTDKDGKNQVSLEVRCTSFDVEVIGGEQRDDAPPAPRRPAPASPKAGDDSEPPFNRSEYERLP